MVAAGGVQGGRQRVWCEWGMDVGMEEQQAADRYRLGEWTVAGETALLASGATAEQALQAGLDGVLAAMRGAESAAVADESATVAVPIRGSGRALGALFADLVADLLTQTESAPEGIARVRLDGLIRTDEGLTAWGYALRAGRPGPAAGVALAAAPTITREDGRYVLRCALRRAWEPRP